MSAVELVALGRDARLITYDVTRAGRRSRRCSIWVRVAGAWLLRYHQGTLAADQGPEPDEHPPERPDVADDS